MKSMYLLDSQKCINYSIQRIAKGHLRCGLLWAAKEGIQLCELRRGRGLGKEDGWGQVGGYGISGLNKQTHQVIN